MADDGTKLEARPIRGGNLEDDSRYELAG